MKDKWARQHRYRERHPEANLLACKKWRASHADTFRESKAKWHREHPEWRGQWLERRRKQMRDAAFAAYGGYQCMRCPVNDPVVLTLDHINNDGAKHRKELKAGGTGLFEWMRQNKYPPIFQVLCRNCNWRKHIETLKVQRLGRKPVEPSGSKRGAPRKRVKI